MISVYFSEKGGTELKCSRTEQTVTLWPCLSSTKPVDFMFPDSSIVQCGAEAHSHQVSLKVDREWQKKKKTTHLLLS